MEKKSNLSPITKKEDVIEIPIGKYFEKIRENPWIITSFVLGIALIISIIVGSGSGSSVSSQKAGENLIQFVNSQGQGAATLISAEREGNLHKITVSYEGQELPVYTTLDGEFLVSSLVPIGDSAPTNIPPTDSGTGTADQTSADDDAVLGDPNAPITIIEFSDYQCPYCRKFWQETLPSLKADYIDTGLVKLVYRDFPLVQIHPMASPAAQAAECVRAQGGDDAYFAYHDVLFEKQTQLSDANFKAWAKELGYNIDSCLDSGQFEEEVLKDMSDGGSLGTPTFFINGVKLEGAIPYSSMKQVIDSQLAAMQ